MSQPLPPPATLPRSSTGAHQSLPPRGRWIRSWPERPGTKTEGVLPEGGGFVPGLKGRERRRKESSPAGQQREEQAPSCPPATLPRNSAGAHQSLPPRGRWIRSWPERPGAKTEGVLPGGAAAGGVRPCPPPAPQPTPNTPHKKISNPPLQNPNTCAILYTNNHSPHSPRRKGNKPPQPQGQAAPAPCPGGRAESAGAERARPWGEGGRPERSDGL